MCCACGGGSTSIYATETPTTMGENYPVGIVIMGIEIIGWIMFYRSYKDSVRYAKYLINQAEEDLVFDSFRADVDF